MQPSGAHAAIPADQCYWAVLDVSSLPAGQLRRFSRTRRRQLGYLFERMLPVPVETVYTAYVQFDSQRVLACAADRSQDDVRDGVMTLAPDAVPSFVEADIDPARLNLLTGDDEPPAVRRARGRWMLELAVAIVLVSCVAIVGLHRRTVRAYAERAALETALAEVYDAVLTNDAPSAQPPSLRLTTELRRLERTRSGESHRHDTPSAAITLGNVLAHWPARVEARTDLLTITEDSVTIRAVLADNARAQSFAGAFDNIGGWPADQPQVRAGGDGVMATIRLSREGGEP